MISKTNVTTSPTIISAARERDWLMIQNQSDTPVFLSFDGSSDLTTDTGAKPGIRLSPYDSIMTDDSAGRFSGNNLPIYAIHGGVGNKVVVVQEL